MNKFRIIYLILVILFGVFMIVFGEKDDSPGAQGIGLIIIIICIVKILKKQRKIVTAFFPKLLII